MTSRQEQAKIIDKRRTDSGTEYLDSITGEWILSSTSRCINPELVELYEWLHNSGYREGATVFSTTHKPNIGWAKGIRKRPQAYVPEAVSPPQSPRGTDIGDTPEVDEKHNITGDSDSSMYINNAQMDDLKVDIKEIKDESQDYNIGSSSPQFPKSKKPRLKGLCNEDMRKLSITPPEIRLPSTSTLSASGASPLVKKEPVDSHIQRQEQGQEVRDFNRYTEQMIEVYFKEGMDRILTIHGPEPFQDIWDVQKRRREVADGTGAFSRQQTSSISSTQNSDPSVISEMSTRSSSNNNDETSASLYRSSLASNSTGRLPSWNSVWDLIKAELGIDNRPESRQHIYLQEQHIRASLQSDEVYQDAKPAGKDGSGGNDEDDTQEVEKVEVIREEQETREEIGRAIVGVLIRVLEQDAVLKNVSAKSYFCKDVLTIDPFSPAQSIRQALDVSFQIIALATSSRYLEPPSSMKSAQISNTGSSGTARPIVPWPLNERCTLNSAGMEILQLGQQFLLLLIRFTEAGRLLPGKGLEELAREVLSRLSKVNKDRKLPSFEGSSGSKKSGQGTSFLLERYSLDQTEIFLKALIQGPCLLDSGTGSGAGVKLRKSEGTQSKVINESCCSLNGGNDYNGILKSQIGICMGSSAFVMFLVDLWFRSKTTVSGGSASGGTNYQLSFRRVVEEYAMPNEVRPSGAPVTTKGSKSKATKKSSAESQDNLGRWNPKDLEQVEWTVMMTEVLVWSWIEARGVRRDEIIGTGLEYALFPDDTNWQIADGKHSSGWFMMSQLLTMVGGTLKSRWEQLESTIEAAILVEDLCLR
ncbi:hypothetical protein BGZ46_009227 [Entomortierella lignicola]|nr:hypothetical protein BGZ46_009227 [Entomortierella lignicola]